MIFLNIMLCYYFSLEAVLLSWLKITLPKKQVDVENRATLKHGPAKKLTEECKVYRYKIDLNYKLQLPASVYQQQSPGKCTVKKVFRKILLLFESLKYLSQETNTYPKLATETLKQDVKYFNIRDCVSLLITCNMSKTSVKSFSGVLSAFLCLL